jgi:hypothetical protein
VDSALLVALQVARRALDVYRERDEAQSDCRVLIRLVHARDVEIAALRDEIVALRRRVLD